MIFCLYCFDSLFGSSSCLEVVLCLSLIAADFIACAYHLCLKKILMIELIRTYFS
jgi:hypothetical protein